MSVRLPRLNPGRPNLDQHLPRPGRRPFHLLHPQHIDVAVVVKPHRPYPATTAPSHPDQARKAARHRVERSGAGSVFPKSDDASVLPRSRMSLPLGRFASVFDRARIDHLEHSVHCGREGLMFPQTYDMPSGFVQGCVGSTVAFDGAAELGRPIPLVCGRLTAMLGARMPEATIDKDSNFPAGEDDVGTDARTAGKVEPVILAVSKPKCMQRTAEGDLRLGVRAAVGPHVAGTAIVGGGGVPGTGCCTVVGRI